MERNHVPEPAILVIFGASGDLTWRKLVPAVFNLRIDGHLPGEFAVLGLDRKEMTDDEFRDRMRDGVDRASRRGKTDDAAWNPFAQSLHHMLADFGDAKSYEVLKKRLQALAKDWKSEPNYIFYLAVPPELFGPVAAQLGQCGLARLRNRTFLVLEKPFGHDLESARELDRQLTATFHESQLYRIDHYMGKETVQNILAFRFANSLFEPIWNRRYIDHMQITVAESNGVEHRGGYYDKAGALRDMVPNHLFQILSMVAMEPPISFDADEVRNKKGDVLKAVRPIPADQVSKFAVRGQYDAGWTKGQKVAAYRKEPRVDPKSNTETFVAVKLFVDNWRWQEVPFYLRTGKRLAARYSEVVVYFRPVPHSTFPTSCQPNWLPNRLAIRIQPEEGIQLRIMAKHPGLTMRLDPVEMKFSYAASFQIQSPEAYEALLLDVIEHDPTQFLRDDMIEAGWSLVQPILDAWGNDRITDFPNYEAGSWGPDAATHLLANDGRSWSRPKVEE
ncbi:MAG: glucose-6-phosphate dehydrogenase [Gemmataceae bacterium]|nr:glucose-6-phosphate dehydrogenase [Gemmataceae bacterium]